MGLVRTIRVSLLIFLALVGVLNLAAVQQHGPEGDASDRKAPPQVREASPPRAKPHASPPRRPSKTKPRDTREAVHEASESGFSAWVAPGIDEVRPPVAVGVTCPQGKVLHEAGMRLKELVDNISRIDATEEIVHEDQNTAGKVVNRSTGEFGYVAQVTSVPAGHPGAGVPVVDEHRIHPLGMSDSLGGVRTKGLSSLAFVFHPAMRDSFEIDCEGLGDWQGRPAWLVRFQQREDRPNYLQELIVAKRGYPVALKGRIWIDAGGFQAIHVESELVHPIPEIKLRVEQHRVDYGPVKFHKKNTELWLPMRAEMYLDFGGRRYYRRHSFANFRLFSVESTQEITAPTTTESSTAPPP